VPLFLSASFCCDSLLIFFHLRSSLFCVWPHKINHATVFLAYCSGHLVYRPRAITDSLVLAYTIDPLTLTAASPSVILNPLSATARFEAASIAHLFSCGQLLYVLRVADVAHRQLAVDVFRLQRAPSSASIATSASASAAAMSAEGVSAQFVRSVWLPCGYTQFPVARYSLFSLLPLFLSLICVVCL
jgi:hypothetical protein